MGSANAFGCRPRAPRARDRRLRVELLEPRNVFSVGPLDVIGHLPVAEYNQFIPSAVNSEGNSYKDWGNEPFVAVNPTDPNKIVVSSFAFDGVFVTGPSAPLAASIWYSTDGGSTWGLRFPIPTFPVPDEGVPNDQTFAYDSSGTLHAAMLSFGFSHANPGLNLFHGTTADPDKDGVNGRPASVWHWDTNRVNLPIPTQSKADQPWLALQGNHAYVGYGFFEHGSVQAQVSASSDGGATFTSDNAISNRTSAWSNPGIRVAAGQDGHVYAVFANADPSKALLRQGQPQQFHYRLNESSDGGVTWKYTTSSRLGGLVVDDGTSLQLGASFGGVNALLGSITAVAADLSGDHVYVVYGKQDATGTDRLYLAEFHHDGSGNLVERANPVALSVPGQRAALPSVAVTANGRVAVQYDTFTPDDGQFHLHLAVSTTQGVTFADQDLYDFTTTGIPFPFTGGNRLLGDYQDITALGNTVFGTFAARGNVNAGGVDTTDKVDPFFYSVTLDGVDSLTPLAPSLGGGGAALSGGGAGGGFTGAGRAAGAIKPVFGGGAGTPSFDGTLHAPAPLDAAGLGSPGRGGDSARGPAERQGDGRPASQLDPGVVDPSSSGHNWGGDGIRHRPVGVTGQSLEGADARLTEDAPGDATFAGGWSPG
jgi:hypothetical protein